MVNTLTIVPGQVARYKFEITGNGALLTGRTIRAVLLNGNDRVAVLEENSGITRNANASFLAAFTADQTAPALKGARLVLSFRREGEEPYQCIVELHVTKDLAKV